MRFSTVFRGLVTVAICLSIAAPVSALSLTGRALDSAVKEDFFTFFHLRKRAVDERDDIVTHYFRPPSRGDVVICVDTDKKDKILQMSLIVGRDFIEDPLTNVFARDIVKSFIEAATPEADSSSTRGLINEIFFRDTELTPNKVAKFKVEDSGATTTQDANLVKVGKGELKKGDVAIVMAGDMPKLPDEISDGYKAFDGKVDDYDLTLTTSHVIMKNHDMPKGRFLEIRIDANNVKKLPKFEVVGEVGDDADEEQSEKNQSKVNESNEQSGKSSEGKLEKSEKGSAVDLQKDKQSEQNSNSGSESK